MNSVSPSKEQKLFRKKVSTATLSPAQPHVESKIIDLIQAFSADEAVTLPWRAPVISNRMASSASAELPEEMRASIEHNPQEALWRNEAFIAREQSTKAP